MRIKLFEHSPLDWLIRCAANILYLPRYTSQYLLNIMSHALLLIESFH